jgi:hypothetical protein
MEFYEKRQKAVQGDAATQVLMEHISRRRGRNGFGAGLENASCRQVQTSG